MKKIKRNHNYKDFQDKNVIEDV